MTTEARPPRKLTAIILVLVLYKAFTAFFPSLSVASVAGLAVRCYLAWNAYNGKQSAAKFLGICLVVFGALGILSVLYVLATYGALLGRIGGVAPMWILLGAVPSILEVLAGAYILRSDAVKSFYQQREGFVL